MFKDTHHKIINFTTASMLKTQVSDLIRPPNNQGYKIHSFQMIKKEVEMLIFKHAFWVKVNPHFPLFSLLSPRVGSSQCLWHLNQFLLHCYLESDVFLLRHQFFQIRTLKGELQQTQKS